MKEELGCLIKNMGGGNIHNRLLCLYFFGSRNALVSGLWQGI